jgi:hypothetical protein
MNMGFLAHTEKQREKISKAQSEAIYANFRIDSEHIYL